MDFSMKKVKREVYKNISHYIPGQHPLARIRRKKKKNKRVIL